MSTTTPKIKVAEPNEFDGSPNKYRDWLRQLLIYIRAKKITDNEEKILLALSYMKTGTASAWATHFFDQHISQPVVDFGTWDAFKVQLDSVFEDKTHGRKAREKLETFRQGNLKIDDYLSRFESLAVDAGIEKNDSELIRLLERNIRPEVIDVIYTVSPLPTTYQNYKSKIVNIGRLQERRQEQKAQVHRPFWAHNTAPAPTVTTSPKAQTSAHAPPQPSHDRRDHTGVTYGGRGRPMEIDALKKEHRCFGCGATGHFRRDCPSGGKEKKISARVILMELTEEEKNELLEGLMAGPEPEPESTPIKEEDFQ